MPDTKMSDDELVGLTRAYLTRRRATPPARDLEENIIRSALARRGSRRLGTVLGVVAVVLISALAGAGVLYLHAGSSGWHIAEDFERCERLCHQLRELGRLLGGWHGDRA